MDGWNLDRGRRRGNAVRPVRAPSGRSLGRTLVPSGGFCYYLSPMNRRLLCLHGHFYQPPRENPWIEEVEVQDTAAPFHDWNERIAAECYGPNAAARLKNGGGYIKDIVNNYRHISFNFGPTLLAWMERRAPEVDRRLLEADAEGGRRRGARQAHRPAHPGGRRGERAAARARQRHRPGVRARDPSALQRARPAHPDPLGVA